MIDRYNWNSPYEAPPLIPCMPNNIKASCSSFVFH